MLLPDCYDVIIVGGRPAGSTLAIRLGQLGLRVLLLERATFPSPHPASSPIIYASAMKLLDEVGADENEYAFNTPRIYRWVNEFYNQFQTFIRVPQAFGRDYGYAIERARFDHALWRLATQASTVTVRQPFTITELIWKSGRVTGVLGRAPDGPIETFTADCVIGADGRFSLVAQKVQARSYDEHKEIPTTVYYAAWQNVEPYDGQGAVMHFCKPNYGYFVLLFDSAEGLTNVAIEGQSALFTPGPGQVEAFYMDMLRRHPLIWRRLARAKRVTNIHGMRNVGNLYRTASGPGWVLVGDALHQKDPIDGQGIYDALFSSKALSQAIISWKRGTQSWEGAMAAYEAAVRAETYPMYLETMNQVKRMVYLQSPMWVDKLLYRLLGSDSDLNRRYGLLIVRSLLPANWLPRSAIVRAVGRGLLSNSYYALARRHHPAEFKN